jgi:single-strand DNA-binding protein
MSGLNRAILAGRLIADPEVRYSQDETAVAHFTIGVSHGGKTDPIDCKATGGLAKICGEYLKKGKLVAVEGKLALREWSTADGRKLSKHEIEVDNLQMLDAKVFNRGQKE